MGMDDDYFRLEEGDTEDNTDIEENTAGWRRVLFRLVALITLLAFTGLVAATSFKSFRNASLTGLISRSFQLKKDINNNLMQRQ